MSSEESFATDYAALPAAGEAGSSRARPRRRAALVVLISSVVVIALSVVTILRRWSSAAGLVPGDHAELLQLLAERPDLAPLMPTIALNADKPPQGRFDDLVPVVFMHGMGDAGSNPGMQSLCKTASDRYPGLYVVCANVANGLSSVTKPLAEQVEEFRQMVTADARLREGFHAIGLSQGGLVLRGYLETRNDPPIKKLISVCVPHGGVGTCPPSPIYKTVCPLWKLAPYTAPLAFADYWKVGILLPCSLRPAPSRHSPALLPPTCSL